MYGTQLYQPLKGNAILNNIHISTIDVLKSKIFPEIYFQVIVLTDGHLEDKESTLKLIKN